MFLPSPTSLPSNAILQLIALTLCLTQVQIAVCGVSTPPNIHNDATEIIQFLIDKSHGSEPSKTIEYLTEDPNLNTEETKPPSKGKIFRKASFHKKSKEQDVKKDIDNNAYPASKINPKDSLSFNIMKMLSIISIHLSKGKDIYADTNNKPIEKIETLENIELFKLLSKADIDSLNIALEESRHFKKDKKRWSSFSLFRKNQSQKEEAITSSQVLNEFKELIKKFSQDENTLNNPKKNTRSSPTEIVEKPREESFDKIINRRKAEEKKERFDVCKIHWNDGYGKKSKYSFETHREDIKSASSTQPYSACFTDTVRKTTRKNNRQFKENFTRPQSAPPIQVADSRIRQSLRNYRKKHPQKKSTQDYNLITNSEEYTDITRAASLKLFPYLSKSFSDTEERNRTRKHSAKRPQRAKSLSYPSKPTSEKQKRPASVVYLGEKPNHDRPSSAPLDKADCNRKIYRSRSNPKQPESTLKNPIKFRSYGPLDRDYEQNESQSGKRVRQVTSV